MQSKRLLAIDTNAKTIKGQRYGFMTGVLYLAPADLGGQNLCPMADLARCKAACLYSAGRGAFSSVQLSRLAKTAWFHRDRAGFMAQLVENIRALVRKAGKAGMIPLVRLNGTSDIRWESIRVTVDGTVYPNIMSVFPNVQFYDYTKIANRRDMPPNYDLTYSYSGAPEFQPYVERAKEAGMRIAVVFRRRADIPAEFLGMRCVDGDDSDLRHLDLHGVVVALYAKGAARKDTSGFVV